MSRRRFAVAVPLLAMMLVGAACGDDDDTASPTTTAAATVAPSPSTTGGAATSAGAVTTAAPATTAAAADEPQQGGDLRIGVGGILMPNLDPPTSRIGVEQRYYYPIYDRLFTFDENLTPQPGLVTSWEFKDNPPTLSLTLADGVKFHDGTPFNAEAVKFNIERGKTDANSNIKPDLATVKDVVVVDDTHADLVLTTMDTSLPGILTDRAGFMVSPAAVAQYGADYAKHPVGTGPYKFKEMVPDHSVTYERNDDYWQDGAPYLDTITFHYYQNQDAAITAFQAGDLDYLEPIPADQAERLKDTKGAQILVQPSAQTQGFYFNFADAPVDTPEVRQAISMAIDRESFGDIVNFGLSTPTCELYPEGHSAHAGVPCDFDADGAKALLATAGHPDGVTIQVAVTNSPIDVRRAEFVKAQLAEVGITAELTVLPDFAQLNEKYFVNPQFHSYISLYSGRPDPTLAYKALFAKDAFLNVGHVDVPGMPELLAQSITVADEDERADVFQDMARTMSDEAAFVPLAFDPWVILVSDKVKGVEYTLTPKPIWSGAWLDQG